MTQIYVVISQGDYLLGKRPEPVAAYMDYPSALAYAKTIFRRKIGSSEDAKDLVFLITISPTPTSTGGSSTAPATSTVSAVLK